MWRKLVIWFSIFVSVACVVLFFFPSKFTHLNDRFAAISNIVALLSMFYAAAALLIASLAYRTVLLSAKLNVKIKPWMATEDGPALSVNRNTYKVTMTRPLSSWHIWLENTGKVSAKYPVVEILFQGAFFSEDSLPGWKATHHANALGWYGFQWSPDHRQVVHPGFPIQLPTMYFAKKVVGKDMAISITTVADGVTRKTIKAPVKFHFYDFNE